MKSEAKGAKRGKTNKGKGVYGKTGIRTFYPFVLFRDRSEERESRF